jgi:hypothetical protein
LTQSTEFLQFCGLMIDSPSTVAALIDAFGGNAAFARVIGKRPSTASEQRRSGSIPVEYWDLVIAAAKERGIPGVTWESLGRMHIPADRRATAEVRA